MRFWVGQSISRLGTRVTNLALPTAAIQLLGAGPAEVGTLAALQFLPFVLLGMLVGVGADRLPRRPVMIACDVGRFAVLGSVPVAYLVGAITIQQLYLVALLVGILTLCFDVAYQAYLPVLVERPRLMEANAKLEIGNSTMSVAGPSVAGALIQWFQAAPAILVDAASYLVSAGTLLSIRKSEPAESRASRGERSTIRQQLAEGLRAVFGHPTIRLIAGSSATANLGFEIVQTVYLLYAYEELGLTPATIGLILGIGSVGGLLGALPAYPVARRIGIGPAMAICIFLAFASFLLLPLAQTGQAASFLAAASFIFHFTVPIYDVNAVTVRQAIVPDNLQGRVVGTVRTFVIGARPVGAALGGLLGSQIGLVPTIVVGASIGMAAAIWILAGPVRLGRRVTAESA